VSKRFRLWAPKSRPGGGGGEGASWPPRSYTNAKRLRARWEVWGSKVNALAIAVSHAFEKSNTGSRVGGGGGPDAPHVERVPLRCGAGGFPVVLA
jgi:hypothetical protein